MMRLICQNMNKGTYEGDAFIYGHDEVIALLKDIAEKLLQPKQIKMIGDRLHLITVHDGEIRKIMDRDVTFFDIHSTKAKQYGFTLDMGNGDKFTCCGDEPYNDAERPYAENSKWLLHEAFCLYSQATVFRRMRNTILRIKDACELAEELHVPNLLLYHTEDKNITHRKELYTAEGTEYYHGNLYIPEDLETIEL